MAAKTLRAFYRGRGLLVPMEGSDRGNARRFEPKQWQGADTPEPIKKVATIMVAELNKRFKLEGIPDANTLLAMKLNPTVNKEVVFSSSQRDAMNACYDLMYDKASSFLTW